jgi:signal transduction histidine kinase
MARTLDTLVAAARVELGAPHGTGDAARAARAAARDCAGLAETHGIAITVEEPASPIRIGVDDDVAERVLAPLIENACRYGRNKVGLTVRPNGESVEFLVEDDGPGVGETEREQIFEPGFRGTAASTDDHRGAGLGLALSRRLARAVGGDVEALRNGAGATFRARIPAARQR